MLCQRNYSSLCMSVIENEYFIIKVTTENTTRYNIKYIPGAPLCNNSVNVVGITDLLLMDFH